METAALQRQLGLLQVQIREAQRAAAAAAEAQTAAGRAIDAQHIENEALKRQLREAEVGAGAQRWGVGCSAGAGEIMPDDGCCLMLINPCCAG